MYHQRHIHLGWVGRHEGGEASVLGSGAGAHLSTDSAWTRTRTVISGLELLRREKRLSAVTIAACIAACTPACTPPACRRGLRLRARAHATAAFVAYGCWARAGVNASAQHKASAGTAACTAASAATVCTEFAAAAASPARATMATAPYRGWHFSRRIRCSRLCRRLCDSRKNARRLRGRHGRRRCLCRGLSQLAHHPPVLAAALNRGHLGGRGIAGCEARRLPCSNLPCCVRPAATAPTSKVPDATADASADASAAANGATAVTAGGEAAATHCWQGRRRANARTRRRA